MSLREKVDKMFKAHVHEGSNKREDWQQELWTLFRKHRGAFGPVIEDEVKSAFFCALAVGAEYGGHLEFSRLTSERGVRVGSGVEQGEQQKSAARHCQASDPGCLDCGLTHASAYALGKKEAQSRFGPLPWKVEDAFEVWLANRHNGAKVDAQAQFSMREAFLAGAEYGAAAGSEPIGVDSENRTDGALGGGSAPSVGAKAVPEVGDTGGYCLTHDPREPNAGCGYFDGHPGIHSWELPADNPQYQAAYSAIPSYKEWKLERCRTLVFAILGGISTPHPVPTGHLGDDLAALRLQNEDTNLVADYIRELGELWETI